jgi:phage-related protein
MMGPIVAEIQGLGIEVQYIPGGCTYLCQPIDVGVNRPIKHAMAEQWEDWIDSEGVQNGNVMATPPRELIATWVVEAYWTLKTETCKKAWTKKGFEWTV